MAKKRIATIKLSRKQADLLKASTIMEHIWPDISGPIPPVAAAVLFMIGLHLWDGRTGQTTVSVVNKKKKVVGKKRR